MSAHLLPNSTLREIKRLSYVPIYFIRMRHEMGTLGALRALIAKPEVSGGSRGWLWKGAWTYLG